MRPLTSADAHKLLMILEGGDKLIKDSGGLTKWGISQKAYPDEDIAAVTEARSRELFVIDYWNAVKADSLPSPLNVLVADAAFNQGPKIAVMMLQRALGNVTVDGIAGRNTIAGANGMSTNELCALFLSRRYNQYAGSRGFDKYGMGWFNRLGRLTMMLSRWSDFNWG